MYFLAVFCHRSLFMLFKLCMSTYEKFGWRAGWFILLIKSLWPTGKTLFLQLESCFTHDNSATKWSRFLEAQVDRTSPLPQIQGLLRGQRRRPFLHWGQRWLLFSRSGYRLLQLRPHEPAGGNPRLSEHHDSGSRQTEHCQEPGLLQVPGWFRLQGSGNMITASSPGLI